MADVDGFDWSLWPTPPGIKDIKAEDRPNGFDSYRGCFNDRVDTSAQPLFSLILMKAVLAADSPRVLDVGCGHGIGAKMEYQQLLSRLSDEYWGIEPDEEVQIDPSVVRHVQRCVLEDAELPEAHFDVVFAMFVIEHVQAPQRFLEKIARCLRPGGQFIFLTPNGSAFFAVVANSLRKLGVVELVHTLLRGAQRHEVEHYPVFYRMNTERQITAAAREAGLGAPQFAYFQFDGTQRYLPGPMRIIYKSLMAARRRRRKPESLDTMVCRITKPSS